MIFHRGAENFFGGVGPFVIVARNGLPASIAREHESPLLAFLCALVRWGGGRVAMMAVRVPHFSYTASLARTLARRINIPGNDAAGGC